MSPELQRKHHQYPRLPGAKSVGKEKYRSYVPYYTFKAAAGYFGLDPSDSLQAEPAGWFPEKNAQPDMFVLQAQGKSMEPLIPDGAYCLFRAGSALAGTRNGRIVLVRSSGINDPDTESSLTIKRYFSTKEEDHETGWRHREIRLVPENPDFETIILTPEDEEDFKVIAEFMKILEN
ncbi:MAG: S24 family peptidase [Desulfobulbaceae bacterium]|nr:S24 family peptidase [Desulfobulbaceae bacterium]